MWTFGHLRQIKLLQIVNGLCRETEQRTLLLQHSTLDRKWRSWLIYNQEVPCIRSIEEPWCRGYGVGLMQKYKLGFTVADSEAPDCHSKVRITLSPRFKKLSSMHCCSVASKLILMIPNIYFRKGQRKCFCFRIETHSFSLTRLHQHYCSYWNQAFFLCMNIWAALRKYFHIMT